MEPFRRRSARVQNDQFLQLCNPPLKILYRTRIGWRSTAAGLTEAVASSSRCSSVGRRLRYWELCIVTVILTVSFHTVLAWSSSVAFQLLFSASQAGHDRSRSFPRRDIIHARHGEIKGIWMIRLRLKERKSGSVVEEKIGKRHEKEECGGGGVAGGLAGR